LTVGPASGLTDAARFILYCLEELFVREMPKVGTAD